MSIECCINRQIVFIDPPQGNRLQQLAARLRQRVSGFFESEEERAKIRVEQGNQRYCVVAACPHRTGHAEIMTRYVNVPDEEAALANPTGARFGGYLVPVNFSVITYTCDNPKAPNDPTVAINYSAFCPAHNANNR